MPLENKQITAMAAWTLEDIQNDPLGAVAQVRELASAYQDLQKERDAAVSDIEYMMRFTGNFGFCRMCARDISCNLEDGSECNPQWRGPREVPA